MSQISNKLPKKSYFWLLLLAAIIIHQIPIISVPFKWLESYFHEISHGLAAIVTGGRIVRIELFANGAGLCTTIGGVRFVVAFMGYAGATLWGVLLYALGSSSKKIAILGNGLVLILLALTLLLWVQDLRTSIIIGSLVLLFVIKLKFGQLLALPTIFRLTGLLVLLNSMYSPLYLLDGRSLGDGATLAQITLIPELIWVLVWSVLALASLYTIGKKS